MPDQKNDPKSSVTELAPSCPFCSFSSSFCHMINGFQWGPFPFRLWDKLLQITSVVTYKIAMVMQKLSHLLVGAGHIESVDVGFRGIIKPNHHLIHIFSEQVSVSLMTAIIAKVSCEMRKLTTCSVLAEEWRAMVRVA